MKFTIALIAILSLASISNAADAKCDTFKCATIAVPEGSCIKAATQDNKKVYHIKLQCKDTEVCAMTGEDETKCKTIPTPERKNGIDTDACEKKEECYTGLECTDKKCVGKANDSECTSAYDCKVGSSCIGGKCKAQIPDDKTECASDFDCANTHFCNSKKCTAYYTLDNGAEISADSKNYCKSRETFRDGAKVYCATSTLQGSEWKCSADAQTKCKYTIKTTEEKKDQERDCTCSLSNATVQYCPADNSKLPAQANAATGVHTTKRWASVKNAAAWPLLEGADSCLAKLASSSFIKVAVAVLSVLALFL
jgi:hypothetical protein